VRRVRQQFHGAPTVLQPLPPLRERLANDREDAVRIGAVAILRKSQLGNRPRQTEAADLEQFCCRAGQNFRGDRGHTGQYPDSIRQSRGTGFFKTLDAGLNGVNDARRLPQPSRVVSHFEL
jgi:hypothetical protein